MTHKKDKFQYQPSKQARLFHRNKARMRFLIWGFKSGKTFAGAVETADWVLKNPNALVWVVAPTYGMLQVCDLELSNIFYGFDDYVIKHNQARHEFRLKNGTTIQMKSADWPDGLRGPNVDFIWIEEGAYISAEAWIILRARVAATKGPIICTTTPKAKGWLWAECLKATMPATMPYGEFGDEDLRRWASHHPTWAFDWVDEDELADIKSMTPQDVYDQEYGAMFLAETGAVFRYIQEALHMVPWTPRHDNKFVLGVDLAKYQDFTAVIALDGHGRQHHVDRWTGVDWRIQKTRIKELAKKWNAIVVLDRSNVGSTIEEDLTADGVKVHPVDMNSAQVKLDLIQALQLSFEMKRIHIADPRAPWSQTHSQALVDELIQYEAKITPGGRLGYSAPKGLHDDLVVALALANWGRLRGLAGGGLTAADVTLGRDEWIAESKEPQLDRIRRPRVFQRIFNRNRTRTGFESSGGPFWG